MIVFIEFVIVRDPSWLSNVESFRLLCVTLAYHNFLQFKDIQVEARLRSKYAVQWLGTS